MMIYLEAVSRKLISSNLNNSLKIIFKKIKMLQILMIKMNIR